MYFKETLKRYAFHLFALLMFLAISVYKFFPNALDFKFNNSTESTETAKEDVEDDARIVVDLSGAVVSPGVYTLPAESRVGEVISLGGGFAPNASVLWISRNINLAKLLYDTQKIYVPYEWETYGDCACTIDKLYLETPLTAVKTSTTTDTSTGAGGENDTVTGASPLGAINVNTATQDDLDSLAGVGPSYAQKIIANRPYSDFTDLVDKSGVPKSTLDKVSGDLTY